MDTVLRMCNPHDRHPRRTSIPFQGWANRPVSCPRPHTAGDSAGFRLPHPPKMGTRAESNHITLWKTAGPIRPCLVHEPDKQKRANMQLLKRSAMKTRCTQPPRREETSKFRTAPTLYTTSENQETTDSMKHVMKEELKLQTEVEMSHYNRQLES